MVPACHVGTAGTTTSNPSSGTASSRAGTVPAGTRLWDVTHTDPSEVPVLIQQLDADLPLPGYAHPGDAGLDLYAREDVHLPAGARATVPTGVAIALPPGYAAFVHPRSGLAARHGITVVNAPGTIDAGYRGEIKVILANTDTEAEVRLARGDRIAQLIIQHVARARLITVQTLPGTARGDAGLGSTGGFGLRNEAAASGGNSTT